MTFYCMNCWVEIEEDCEKCPSCGADQKELLKEDFDAKLIRALSHPEPETILRAIEIIGHRKLDKAAPMLKKIILENRDPFRTAQALKAVSELDMPDKIDFLTEFTREKYGFIIVNTAKDLLKHQALGNGGLKKGIV